jgi:hypothetical protein
MEIGRERLLEYVLNDSLRMIQSLTDLEVSNSIRDELSDALDPLLRTVGMLDYQRWHYTFEMVPAFDGGNWNALDPTEMEGMFAEEIGWVKASLFPQLCRIQGDGQNEVSSTQKYLIGESLTSIQNMRRTVVCKARVAVERDVPSRTEDTEMAGGPDVEAKPDLMSPMSPEERATEQILETIELEHEPDLAHDHVQDAIPQEYVDDSVDDDPMSDLPEEEEIPRTPERGFSETGIPDSLDRAEEERVRGSSWPNWLGRGC